MDKKDIIAVLLESYFDINQDVSQTSFKSLCILSNKNLNEVLSCSLSKFNEPNFLSNKQTEIFKSIKLIEKVTNEINDELDNEIKTNLVLFSINIFKNINNGLALKEANFDSQCESIISNILSNISKKNCEEVTNELIKEFKSKNFLNTNEKYFVIKTLGNLCLVNPIGIIKFVKDLIQEIWLTIKQCKTENQKNIIAFTVGCIATAVLENLANEKGKELTESTNIEVDEYEKDFDMLLDILLMWINTKDNRLKEQLIKTIGLTLPLLSKKKFIENYSKLLEIILMLYKKNTSVPMMSIDFDFYYLSQSLTQFLNASLNNDYGLMKKNLDSIIEIELENLLTVVFRQLTIPVSTSNPNMINNYNEILRAFSLISSKHCNKTINFVLKKFEDNSIASKISGLAILKHLIDTRINEVKEKFSSIFFALRLLVQEDNNKLKKILIQVIVSIAYKGYLNLEGGKFLIQFIIKQCSKDVGYDEIIENDRMLKSNSNSFNSINMDQSNVTNATLKLMAENAIPLFVNTVDNIEEVLWPQLFEYLVLPEYVNATGILCYALYQVGNKLKNTKDFEINFNKATHLPKFEEIMARIVILIGDDPIRSKENIENCMKLMKTIAKLINPCLETLWDTITDQYLEILKLDEQLTKDDWQHKCLALINQSFIEINDENFVAKFGNHLLDHLAFYKSKPDLKYFLLTVLANVVRRFNKKNYTEKIMVDVFYKIDHNKESEREGCALLFGHCAAQFLDFVLVKLEQFFQDTQKGSGFLSSFWSTIKYDKKTDIDKIKATIILALGYVTKFSTTSLLVTRIETPILNSIDSFYESSKENNIVQDAYIKCVKIISTSMTPENLKMIYLLKGRKKLIYEMINLAKLEDVNNEIKIQAIEVLGYLVVLDPVLNNTEKSTLIEVVAKITFSSINLDYLNAFNFLLKKLISKEPTNTQNLSILFEIIIPFAVILKEEEERLLVFNTIELILEEFNKCILPGNFLKLESFCYLCSLILPFTCDELSSIRKSSSVCLYKIFFINLRLKSKNTENDPILKKFKKLFSFNEEKIFNLTESTKECSEIIASKLREENIPPSQLVLKLISSLNHNKGVQKTYGTSLIALELTKEFVVELRNDVQNLIDTIYQSRLDYSKTNGALIEILFNLASNNLNIFCSHLMHYPLPFENDQVAKFWRLISESKLLTDLLITWSIDKLNEEELFFYDKKKTPVLFAKSQYLSIICYLGELFKNQDIHDIVYKKEKELFASLILSISSYVNIDYLQDNSRKSISTDKQIISSIKDEEISESYLDYSNEISTNEFIKCKPVKYAILTFKQLLNLMKHDKMMLSLESENCWKLMEDPYQFFDAIWLLSKAIYTYQLNLIPSLVKPFTSSLNHKFTERRIVPVAFFSYLLSLDSFPDKELLKEPFLNTILNKLNDPAPIIRSYCIKSLGLVNQLDCISNQKFVVPTVMALVNGLDDSDDSNDLIKQEALNSLSIVLSKIDLNLIKDLIVNLLIRLKSFFTKENVFLQEKSIETVGWLLKNSDLKDLLIDESIYLIIHLLITLNDLNVNVVKMSMFSLLNVSKIIKIQSLTELLNKNLKESSNFHYNDFTFQISKLLVQEFNDNLDNFISILLIYLKSDNIRIQCNSIQIIGSLFCHDTENEISSELKQKAILLIIHLLRESSNIELKIKAANVLTNF